MNVWTKIRKRGKFIFDLLVTEKVKTNLLQAIPFWLASFVTGLIAVGYTTVFYYAEDLSSGIMEQYRWSVFLITPVFFLFAWWIVKKWAPTARGSGIPQVMAAIEIANPKEHQKIGRLLSLRIMITKIISSIMMVIGGGAIGREGPTIQIAASVFKITDRLIPASWPRMAKKNYILTGAAAGLAAAFNTPLGGMVFAMEELAKTHVRFFRTALFSAVIIAGLTAQGILGPYLYLGYPNVSNLPFVIFFSVAATAIIAGIGGGLMGKAMLRILKFRSSLKKPVRVIAFILLAGLIIASIAYYINPLILGSGQEVMNSALFTENKHVEWHTMIFRFFGTAISFCVGAAGGIFAPSLAAGATVGSWFSGILDLSGSSANILILSGMVGFLTGVTRTPFTSAILVLEMTDRHSVIFHLMLAAMVSHLAALLVDQRSFYDHLKKDYLQEIRQDQAG